MKIDEKKNLVLSDYGIFLNYMKAKFPLFHNSNVFLRDIKYAVKHFIEEKGYKASYTEAEIISDELITKLQKDKILERLSDISFKLNYPDFVTTKPGDPL